MDIFWAQSAFSFDYNFNGLPAYYHTANTFLILLLFWLVHEIMFDKEELKCFFVSSSAHPT